MRVIRTSEVEEQQMPTVTPIPGWTGGSVSRTVQPLVTPDTSDYYNAIVVNFSKGATTGFHVHSSDQILVITAGVGIVATEHEEREVAVGDIAHILAGENHWHGAKKDSTMSHISILTATG